MYKKLSKSLIVVAIVLMTLALFLWVGVIGEPIDVEACYNNQDNVDVASGAIAGWNNNYDTAITTSDTGYEVESFSTIIDCSKGRKALVKETIIINYFEESQGFFRYLNLGNYEDYYNISVEGADYKLDKENGYLSLRIGTKGEYVIGRKQYQINYTVVMPKYKDSKDSMLYQVVPYGFTTRINNFDVKFIMPTDKYNDIHIHSGVLGIEGNPYANYKVEGNILHINGVGLGAENGVGVRIDFPKGTLSDVVNLEPLYIFLIGAVILIVAIVVLALYGRDDKIVEVVRFDPPYNMSPTDVGYLIDGKVDNEDITNLFFHWAKLGAMEIHQENKNVVFVKTGELPDNVKAYEKSLFSALFIGGDIVNPSNLNPAFISRVNSTKSSLKREFAGRMYTKQSETVSKAFMLVAVLFVVLVSILSDYIKYGAIDYSIGFLGIIIGFIIYGYYFLGKHLMELILKVHEKKKRTMYFFGYGLLGIVIAIGCMFLLSFMQKFILIKSFCMIICPIITCWIAPYIHKRTPEYNEILGEILGFRNFILVAEKDKLLKLIDENPEYYYDILPYANVLGITDVLQDKFKNIPLEMPYWYRSNVGIFDIYIMNSLARDITSAVVSQTAQAVAKGVGNSVSKFGGGSSGGGFSGGGFGGGGGSRW